MMKGVGQYRPVPPTTAVPALTLIPSRPCPPITLSSLTTPVPPTGPVPSPPLTALTASRTNGQVLFSGG